MSRLEREGPANNHQFQRGELGEREGSWGTVGSPAGGSVQAFQRLGYEPELERAEACRARCCR